MRRLGLLLAGVVLPVLLWSLVPVPSTATPTSPNLSDVQRRLQAAERRLSNRRGREGVLTTDIARYDRRIRGLQGRIDQLGRRQAAVQTDLDRKQRALTRTQSSLRAQRARGTRLRLRLRVVRRLLARRLVELYEADRPGMITVVLNSSGFADLLERADFLGRIAASDRSILLTVRRARRQAVSLARSLADLERRQSALTAVVITRRDTIASVRRNVLQARAGLDAARGTKHDALASVRASSEHVRREVADLRGQQAKIERAVRQAQAANTSSPPSLPAAPVRGSGGGPMIWPVNGPITSPFCERRSYEACHPGIDIGVPEGTPIRAAAAGKVILMQPVAASGGYGNYTCVQHTATLSSCYAHQSRFGTSIGAQVRQGQIIGYVGNTGHSFGAHLHWEVRINGVITNPLNYV